MLTVYEPFEHVTSLDKGEASFECGMSSIIGIELRGASGGGPTLGASLLVYLATSEYESVHAVPALCTLRRVRDFQGRRGTQTWATQSSFSKGLRGHTNRGSPRAAPDEGRGGHGWTVAWFLGSASHTRGDLALPHGGPCVVLGTHALRKCVWLLPDFTERRADRVGAG